jgi:hypothetical protein
MSEQTQNPYPPLPPVSQWMPVLVLAWLIPGGGHFYQKRYYRGALLAGCIVISFVLGLMMRGFMFQPTGGDVLTAVIYYGGFISDLATGLLYFMTRWFGYTSADLAGHAIDYGTKFLVAAGLLTILAMVDAWEIAVGRKE